MKLKYLFGAMALPALVASCSNEEILVEKGDLQANRPMAGEVTLAVADGSVESRWTSAGFQAGTDIIGAALMDNFTGTEANPAYTLSNDIKTNYKFNYTENGTWESDALFSEGHYFFYMQYNPEMRGRSGLYNTIPSVQEIGANGAAARYANQLFLGYYFISGGADNLDLPVAMVETYAFPRVAATYEGNNGVVIEKVIANSANFVLERQLNVTADLTGVGAYDANENGVSDTGDVAANSKLNDYLKAFNSALQNGKAQNGVPAAVKAAVAKAMAAKADKVASSITIVPETAAGTIDGAFVAPAGTYTLGNKITFEIYTNKGIVTVAVPDNRKDTKYTYSNEQYAENDPEDFVKVVAEKFPTAFSAGEGGSSKKFEIFFMDDAITVPSELKVSSVEELTKYLTNWYTGYDLNGTTAGKGELTVIITENIVLNDAVMSFLADTTNPKVKFTTTAGKTVTIPATAAAATINTVKAQGLNVIIAEGATQIANVGNTSATLAASNIVNKGTLTVQANKAAAVTTIANLVNMGTLNVNTELTSSSVIVNGNTSVLGSLNLTYGTAGANTFNGINEEAEMNVSADINATVVTYGKLNVKTDASIASVQNCKVKYAEGTTAAAVKTAEMTIDEDARLLVAGENCAKITVNGVLTAVEDFTNNGEIINNYGIENKSGVQLNNNGYITVGEDASFTIVYDNVGTIEILDRETEIKPKNNVGTILYTADDASTFTVMADDRFNTVKFNGNKTLKVEGENVVISDVLTFVPVEEALDNLKALAVLVAADGKFKFDVTANGSIAKFIVDAGIDATIASDVTITDEIKIGTGASIQLNREYNLYFDNAKVGSFVNNGTFRNLGYVKAACPEPDNFNDINFIGDNYTWLSIPASSLTTLTAVTSNTELTGNTEITAASITSGVTIEGNGNTLIIPASLDITGVTIKNATIVVKSGLVTSRALPVIAQHSYAVKAGAGTVIEGCSFEAPLTNYDIYIENVNGNITIKDCKFLTPTAENQAGYGKRAIYSPSGAATGNLHVEGCEFDDKVYAFNFNNTGRIVTFKKCDLKGWLSGYAAAFTFDNCNFAKSGEYAHIRPYGNATFVNCNFSNDFTLDHPKAQYNVESNYAHTFTACKVGGVAFANPNKQLLDDEMSETAKSKLSFTIDTKSWTWDGDKKEWTLPAVAPEA